MPLSRKIATLIYKGKTTVPDVVSLLTQYKMLALLPFVKQSLIQMSSFANKNDVIMIESPFELSPSSLQKIKRIVGNDMADHEVIINKEVLAGFKATFRGMMYDGSADRIIKQLLAK